MMDPNNPAAPAPAEPAAPAPGGVGLGGAPAPAPTPTPTPAAPAAPAPGVGLGGAPAATQTQEAGWWREHLSPENKDHSSLQTIGSLDDMVKTYISGQQMIGKDKIVRVGADADSAVKQAFMKELGWGFAPEDAAGYSLNIDGIEGFGDLNPMKDFMGGLFHKLGVDSGVGNSIFTELMQHEQNQHSEDLKAVQQDKQLKINALREKLGPSYDHTISKAQRAIAQISPDGALMKLFQDSHLEAEPALIEMAALLGDSILGDNLNPGNLAREFTTTPADAESEITKLQGDKDFMLQYQTRQAPGHAEAVKRMQDLYTLAFPETQS